MSSMPEQNKVQEIVPLLYVKSMQDSVQFYCGQLGFDRVMSWEPDGVLKWCRIELDGAALMLQAIDEEGTSFTSEVDQRIIFFFNCDDVELKREEFASKGVTLPEIEVAFYGMRQLEFRDPDGYYICFQSPVNESTG